MHDRVIIVNTTPLIALSAAGCIEALPLLYERVFVPREVAEEIRAGGAQALGVRELLETPKLEVQVEHSAIPAYLANALDRGEAAVIATALAKGIRLVCIDETVGRRAARLAGLEITGSIGILIKAKRQGFPVVVRDAIRRMRERGIWLSETVIHVALAAVNED
jgi:predicted nucleic acid-binding protein